MQVRASTLPLSLFVMAIIIIGAGGLIRINDAGESCPEWPTCFGELGFVVTEEEQERWWQEHPDEIDSRGAEHRYTIFEIFTEWVHRLFVGIIAIPMIWVNRIAQIIPNATPDSISTAWNQARGRPRTATAGPRSS